MTIRAKTSSGLSDPFPDVVRIEPAGVCNFHCRHCIVGKEGGRRGLLSYDDYVTLFDKLPLMPRVLVLYHGGEPLLNPAIGDMVNYAKDKGVHYVVLNTNASRLNGDIDLSRLDELRVSFDGYSPADNDAIRIGGEFKWDARRVRSLALSSKRPRQITVYNINKDGQVPLYLTSFFKGVLVVFRSEMVKEWPTIAEDAINPENCMTYCPNLWETFTILSNGDVVSCCEDLLGQVVYGNAFDESVLQIWARMQTVRDNFGVGRYPELCKTCWRMK